MAEGCKGVLAIQLIQLIPAVVPKCIRLLSVRRANPCHSSMAMLLLVSGVEAKVEKSNDNPMLFDAVGCSLCFSDLP